MKDLYICEKIHRDWRAIGPYVPPVVDHTHTTHFPSFKSDDQKVEYVGPLSLWKGKTAIAHNLVAVQFDDRGQYMSCGWHLFNASDWKVPEKRPLYQVLAKSCVAVQNCLKNNNTIWFPRWTDFIERMAKECLPSGGGFDSSTTVDIDASSDGKLVLNTSFHHMNGDGLYDGWTEHQVFVTPSLQFGFNLRVTGPNRNQVKDLIDQVFNEALKQMVDPHGAKR